MYLSNFSIYIICLFCLGLNACAQQVPVDYSTEPYWINMMGDTTINFNETEKAFNAYWDKHEKPEDENELFKNPTQKKTNKRIKYAFEYRKFRNWEENIKPYVRADGSIPYPYQRLQMRKASRKE